jgi:hypothetical protein
LYDAGSEAILRLDEFLSGEEQRKKEQAQRAQDKLGSQAQAQKSEVASQPSQCGFIKLYKVVQFYKVV